MRPDITKRMKIHVLKIGEIPSNNPPIRMSVGLKKCLHIEFEFQKTYYGLSEEILGVIYFHLISVSIKFMEIAFINRDVAGAITHSFVSKDFITKFEVMDGTPVRCSVLNFLIFR